MMLGQEKMIPTPLILQSHTFASTGSSSAEMGVDRRHWGSIEHCIAWPLTFCAATSLKPYYRLCIHLLCQYF